MRSADPAPVRPVTLTTGDGARSRADSRGTSQALVHRNVEWARTAVPDGAGRGSRVRKLVITVLVLAGLVVAADFGAAAAAEYQIATHLRSEFDLQRDPSVRINGFPFLTQALSGTYSSIDIRATGLPMSPLTDVAVEATLYDVDAPLDELMSGSMTNVAIDRVKGQVRIKDTDLGRAIGIEDLRISRASDEEINEEIEQAVGSETIDEDSIAPVRLAATTDLVGEHTEVIVLGVLALDDGVVRMKPSDVRLSTDDVGEFSLPSTFRKPLLDAFRTEVDPGSLPFSVSPTEVHVRTGAIIVAGTASDVSFSQAELGSR